MTNIPPIIAQTCAHCGAEFRPNAKQCWLCYEPMPLNPYAADSQDANQGTKKGSVPVAGRKDYPPSKWDPLFAVMLLLCLALTVLVGIGMVVQDRGMLVPFGILVGQALGITIVRGMVQSGTRVRPGSLLLTFIVSIVATVLILVLLLAALIGLLFLICLSSGIK